MNSPDHFPLDAFGMEQTTSPDPGNERARVVTDLASTVIALDSTLPLRPRQESWHAISTRISSNHPISCRRHITSWLGWVAAAVMASFLLVERSVSRPQAGKISEHLIDKNQMQPTDRLKSDPIKKDLPPLSSDASQNQNPVGSTGLASESKQLRDSQRSLIQEIDILRKKIVVLASRDAERLTPQHGISWPIIMKLTAPGSDYADTDVSNFLLSSILFDVNDQTQRPLSGLSAKNGAATRVQSNSLLPGAVPIYDPARDTGLLVMSNLSQPAKDKAYHLWVESDTSPQPVLVGTLPEHITPSENFAFKLGAVGIIPDRFVVTQDSRLAPTSPNTNNIVLQGPSPKSQN